MSSSPPYDDSASATAGKSQLGHTPHIIFSLHSYVMLAALLSLLLLVLLLLLLHVSAKCFLLARARARARCRRRRASSASAPVSHSLSQAPPLRHFHSFTAADARTSSSGSLAKPGLDPSLVASFPLFVYGPDIHESRLECVICLSDFEDDEAGRQLPSCGHVFHVECIDMWLHSHATCPICRAPVVDDGDEMENKAVGVGSSNLAANGINNSSERRLDLDLHLLLEESHSTDVQRTQREMESDLSGATGIDIAAEAAVTNPFAWSWSWTPWDLSEMHSSASSSSSNPWGYSLTRMMSWGRAEPKVYPSLSSSAADAATDSYP